MGFFEKVKNMFTEEVEEDDVKVEQIKKEVTHVSIESPKTEETEDTESSNDTVVVESEKESKPIFFDDNDFRDLNLAPKHEERNTDYKEKDIYGSKLQSEKIVEEKKVFKPTPIISPVYGVLDKNYHKEDIVSRSESSQENVVQESPIDMVRNKAYGTLEDELENTLFGSNSILFKKEKPEESNEGELDKKEEVEIIEVDEDVSTDDLSKELDELLIKKENHNDDEQKNDIENVEDEDLLGFIDSTLYKEGDE